MTTTTVAVKERPVIFSGAMVRAILEGRKTQTRRVNKLMCGSDSVRASQEQAGYWEVYSASVNALFQIDRATLITCPYGQPGERLWVRETWHYSGGNNIEPSPGFVSYRADGEFIMKGNKWRPSIFMPRWASRISLEITDVRVERVQDISEDDARAEGVQPFDGGAYYSARQMYAELWDSINAKRGYSWAANPFVWAITFKRL